MSKRASRAKTAYVCNDCGAEYSKWQGQCSACQAWNTLSEVRIPGSSGGEAREARFRGIPDHCPPSNPSRMWT